MNELVESSEDYQRIHAYIECLIDGKPKFTAAKIAGFPDHVVRNAEKLIESKRMFVEMAAKLMPSPVVLFTKLQRGMNATKTIYGGKQGMVEVPDEAIRFKYIELGFKLTGKLKGGEEKSEAPEGLKYTKALRPSWAEGLEAPIDVTPGEELDGVNPSKLSATSQSDENSSTSSKV